jgi:hypothetical protein
VLEPGEIYRVHGRDFTSRVLGSRRDPRPVTGLDLGSSTSNGKDGSGLADSPGVASRTDSREAAQRT